MKKRCVFVLPYFGKFNNYFQLFLNSFSFNSSYDLFIFTDCIENYNYPSNVKVIKTTLFEVKTIAEQKLGFKVCLGNPYKLCDFKPAYGLLFEEYISGYEYWGHCDCDILFGNLEKLLTPLLEQDYDKLFAAGHMTIYKNAYDNNRRFMSEHNGIAIYKEAFTTPDIYVFDEDCQTKHNNDNNVHSIFLENGNKVYADDLSMNCAAGSAKLIRASYIPRERRFVKMPYVKARYYFSNGNIFSLELTENEITENELNRKEYLYMHFQMRKMRTSGNLSNQDIIEILPDRFRACKKIPSNIKELKFQTIGFPYLFWFDVFIRKLKRTLNIK